MSNYTIEIIPPDVYYLDINTSFNDTLNNGTNILEIVRSENVYNLEVVNSNQILISDLPNNIPISKISGNLPANRIDGLEQAIITYATGNVRIDSLRWGSNYTNIGLDGYLDQYEFDCGIPR